MFTSKYLILRLIILRCKSEGIYRIAYGSVTPAASTMSKPIARQFNKLGTYSGKKWDYSTIVFAYEYDTILGIFHDFAIGHSLKKALIKWGVDDSSIDFDVNYNVVIDAEPWRSEMLSERQLLYSKVLWMQEPESLFAINNTIPTDCTVAMEDLAREIERLTKLPFTKQYNHIGNLELLYTPDRDANGKPLVECKLDKDTFEFTITVDPQLTDGYDKIIANVRLSCDGAIVCDNICTEIVTKKHVTLSFGKDGCVDTSTVKIWLQKGDSTHLVYDVMTHYIRQINIRVNSLSHPTIVKTDWMEKLRSNLSGKKEKDVDKASFVEHNVTEHTKIGDVSERRRRKTVVTKRVKSNDVFFPKGWDKDTDVVGILGFLEWFKSKTKGAKSVFLQDPYFDDVALFFLASADSNCEYTILTQSSLKTNTDGTDSFVEEGERKDKIINGIKNYPRLFAPMKLVVRDMPGIKAKLHDRYLIFWYDGFVEAYTLSNSLQGATLKQPLLITQIGDEAFEHVNKHIEGLISINKLETLYDYSSTLKEIAKKCREIADEGFYNWLISMNTISAADFVKLVLPDILKWNSIPKISTLGYYLATSDPERCYELECELLRQMSGNRLWIDLLKDYILVHHYDAYPVGYRDNNRRDFSHYGIASLLSLPFEQIVSHHNVHILDYASCEGYSCGVWGQYYAVWLLLRLDASEFIDIIRQYKPTYDSILTDKSIEPIYKSANVIFQTLTEYALYEECTQLLELLLSDNDDWCRGVGCLILLHKSRKEEFDPEKFKGFLSLNSEIIKLCNTAWAMMPKAADKSFFFSWLVETYKLIGEGDLVCQDLVRLMTESHYLDSKKEFVTNVIEPLIAAGLLDKDIVSQMLIENLFDGSMDYESARKNDCNIYFTVQRVLPVTLRIIDGDLHMLLDKANVAYNKAKGNLDNLVVKSEDNLFFAGKPLIYLRNLLVAVISEYESVTTNSEVKQLSELCDKVNKLLDDVGLDNTKIQFEYSC